MEGTGEVLDDLQDACVKRSRSGRICLPPLAWWVGERLVTTLQLETPTRYVAPQYVDSPQLLSTDMHERHKRMSLNHSNKSIERSKSKNRNSGTKNDCHQDIPTSLEKNEAKNQVISSRRKKRQATPNGSVQSKVSVENTVNYLKPDLQKCVIENTDRISNIGSEINFKSVRKCINFGHFACQTTPFTGKMQLRSRKPSGEMKPRNCRSGATSIETHENRNSKRGYCVGAKQEKCCNLNYNRDAESSKKAKRQKTCDIQFGSEKHKTHHVNYFESSSEETECVTDSEKMSWRSYCNSLESNNKLKDQICDVKTSDSKNKIRNIENHKDGYSSKEKSSTEFSENMLQGKNCLMYTPSSAGKNNQENHEVKGSSSKNKAAHIEDYIDDDIEEEKECFSVQKDVVKGKTYHACPSSNNKQKKQVVCNAKTRTANTGNGVGSDPEQEEENINLNKNVLQENNCTCSSSSNGRRNQEVYSIKTRKGKNKTSSVGNFVRFEAEEEKCVLKDIVQGKNYSTRSTLSGAKTTNNKRKSGNIKTCPDTESAESNGSSDSRENILQEKRLRTCSTSSSLQKQKTYKGKTNSTESFIDSNSEEEFSLQKDVMQGKNCHTFSHSNSRQKEDGPSSVKLLNKSIIGKVNDCADNLLVEESIFVREKGSSRKKKTIGKICSTEPGGKKTTTQHIKMLAEDYSSGNESSSGNVLNTTFIVKSQESELDKTTPIHDTNLNFQPEQCSKNKISREVFPKTAETSTVSVTEYSEEAENVKTEKKSWKGRKLRQPIDTIEKIQPKKSSKLKANNSSKGRIFRPKDVGAIFAAGSDKKPSKGSLKRKRWLSNKLEEFNKEHNDDFFEGKEEFSLKNILNLEKVLNEKHDDLDLNFHTPKVTFKMTSSPAKQKIPEVCISTTPSEFNCNRTIADQYLYSRERLERAKRKNEAHKKKTPEIQNMNIVVNDQHLNKMLEKLSCSEGEENAILSDDLDEYRFSDSDDDESLHFMKNY